LATAAPEVARNEYAMARVRVRSEDGEPSLAFEGPWGAEPEPDQNVQILGRRWLAGSGDIVLGAVGEGRVDIQVFVPHGTDLGEHRTIADGGEQQVVRVATDCGDAEQYL